MRTHRVCLLILAALSASAGRGCSTPQAGTGLSLQEARGQAVLGCRGTYDAPPRGPDGGVDIVRLAEELAGLSADSYNWLIWHAATDWEDLQRFLPLAGGRKLRVWVTLVPPSESPPRTKWYSEPFRLDYDRWAEEIARLAAREPALVAWSIDDFAHNLSFFTPRRTAEIVRRAREIHPPLAFVPCIYYGQATEKLAREYRGLLDAVLFPYRHESGGANLTDASQVGPEVARLRKLFGPDMPIILDVYATAHSRLGDSTPQYVREVMQAARTEADGVMIYCHQRKDTSPGKHAVIAELFSQWAAEK